MKIANRDARKHTQQLKEFQGSNLYGATRARLYVVFSYGEHYPMFIYDPSTQTWYENTTRWSVTTSKHRMQSHPLTDTEKRSNEEMKDLINQAYRQRSQQ